MFSQVSLWTRVGNQASPKLKPIEATGRGISTDFLEFCGHNLASHSLWGTSTRFATRPVKDVANRPQTL